MRVRFCGEDFKKAMDRVGVVIPKKSPVPILECVRIEANSCGGKFTVFATNMEAFVSVDIPAEVKEDGIVYAYACDLKRIAIPGDVTLETADGNITANNGKKKSSIPHTQYTDEEYCFVKKPESILLESTERKLITTLTELAPFVLDDDKNAITNTFHLDGKNNRIYALDGHKVAVKKEMFATEKEVAIPCNAYTHLKKIASGKSDDAVKVYSDGKYVLFSGRDFEYTTRVVEKATGQYSIDRLFDSFQPDAEFTFSAEEMGKLAREYGKITKSAENINPMYISFGTDTIKTGVVLPDFVTSDKLDDATCKNADGALYAVNPFYIRDAMDLFSGKITASFCKGKGVIQKKQILIEDDTYKVIILPVNCSEEKANAFVRFAN